MVGKDSGKDGGKGGAEDGCKNGYRIIVPIPTLANSYQPIQTYNYPYQTEQNSYRKLNFALIKCTWREPSGQEMKQT